MKAKYALVVCVVFVCCCGCDNQSPNVRYVQGIETSLLKKLDGYPENMDDCRAAPYDFNFVSIVVAAHGIRVKAINFADEPVSGIKTCLEILRHYDPTGGDGDIWDEISPDGVKYGNVLINPGARREVHGDKYYGFTCRYGYVEFYLNLGDPDYFYGDMNYINILPKDGRRIHTVVDFKLSIVGKETKERVKYCSCTFVKEPYMNMFYPDGGMFARSFSYLCPSEAISSCDVSNQSFVDISDEPNLVELPEKQNPGDYPYCPKDDGKVSICDEPNIIYAKWLQLADVNGYWEYIEPEYFFSIPADINTDMSSVFYWSEPYTFTAQADVGRELTVGSLHTVNLIAKNNDGIITNKYPIQMKVSEVNDTIATFWTKKWVLLCDNPELESEGTMYLGSFIVFRADPLTKLSIQWDDCYGDFDFDNVVDWKDFALFAQNWGKDITDTDILYDYDKDGDVDYSDLREFACGYLGERDTVLRMDYSGDGKIDWIDYAKWCQSPDALVDGYGMKMFNDNWLMEK